jgi:hypothetical protein
MNLKAIMSSFLACFLFAGVAQAQDETAEKNCDAESAAAQAQAESAFASCKKVRLQNNECKAFRDCKRTCRRGKKNSFREIRTVKRDCKSVAKNAFRTCKTGAKSNKRDCRGIKKSCINSCKGKKGKAKRTCKKSCRSSYKSCKRAKPRTKDCRKAKRDAYKSCRASSKTSKGKVRGARRDCVSVCKTQFLDGPCQDARQANRNLWGDCAKGVFQAFNKDKANKACEAEEETAGGEEGE